MSYTDLFGTDAIPPATTSYSSHSLTANTTLIWPQNYSGTGSVISKVMEITSTSAIDVTLPDADEVSVGEDFIIKNAGAFNITVKSSGGATVILIEPNDVVYLYLKTNTTAAGTWGIVQYGVGTSTADANTLAGNGLTVSGGDLQTDLASETETVSFTITAADRAKFINFTGGFETCTFDSVTSLINGFFVAIRNSGTGTLVLNPDGSEEIDGALTLNINPGESIIVCSNGTNLYTIGLGRSTLYQFTQLTKDVTTGTPFTLSATEASNKLLTFIGSPGATVTVIVPAIVSVYYVFNNLSTAQDLIIKTASGSGATVSQSGRAIVFCDGTSVFAAQTVAVSSALPMVSGSAASPGLYFDAVTNTGFYLSGTEDIGLSVNGTSVAVFSSTGLNLLTTHAALTAAHGVSGAVVGTTDTQTLTNKKHSAFYYLEKTITQNATGAVNIDLSTGSIFNLTLTGDTTLSITNAPSLSDETVSFVIKITQGGTAYTVTWFTTISWLTFEAAVPSTPDANQSKEFIFTSTSAGNYIGREGSGT